MYLAAILIVGFCAGVFATLAVLRSAAVEQELMDNESERLESYNRNT